MLTPPSPPSLPQYLRRAALLKWQHFLRHHLVIHAVCNSVSDGKAIWGRGSRVGQTPLPHPHHPPTQQATEVSARGLASLSIAITDANILP